MRAIDHSADGPIASAPPISLRTLSLLLPLLWCSAGNASAQPAPVPHGGNESHLAQPAPTRWLDEVKRQRRAWEERRSSARHAFEERRRRQDPWGAAQQEAWQDDVRRRREVRREQMEQKREYFRNLAPPGDLNWTTPLEPSVPPPRPTPEPDVEPPKPLAPTTAAGQPAQPLPLHAPPDWDNLWYYRGY